MIDVKTIRDNVVENKGAIGSVRGGDSFRRVPLAI